MIDKPDTNEVIVVGGFHEIIELCERSGRRIVGVIDRGEVQEIYGYQVLGNDNSAEMIYEKYRHVPLVVCPDDPGRRSRLVEHYANVGFLFATLIDPQAIVSRFAVVGGGAIVKMGAHLSAAVTIGRNVVVNAYANLMHDVVVGDYTTVAPNAVVLGHVRIGSKAYIGSNSTILPGICIGARSIVGAGAVVTDDVPEDVTVAGVPARVLVKNQQIQM